MTPERYAKVKAVLNKRQKDLTVLMDEVNKPHNLAAIVRTCDAVGVGHAHAIAPSKRLRLGNNTTSGSTKWVRVDTHADIDSAAKILRAQGMQLVCTQLSDRSVDFREIDYTKPTCIIVGAEKFGVSEATAAAADHHVIIPMDGMVQSLNVSVATAIVLYEAERQRREKGFYDSPQLDSEIYQKLMTEWLHPRVSAYCQKHGLPYPPLKDDGELAHNPGELEVEEKPEDGEY